MANVSWWALLECALNLFIFRFLISHLVVQTHETVCCVSINKEKRWRSQEREGVELDNFDVRAASAVIYSSTPSGSYLDGWILLSLSLAVTNEDQNINTGWTRQGIAYMIEYNRFKLLWMGKQTLFRQLTRFVELDAVRTHMHTHMHTHTDKNATVKWNGFRNFVASPDYFKDWTCQE